MLAEFKDYYFGVCITFEFEYSTRTLILSGTVDGITRSCAIDITRSMAQDAERISGELGWKQFRKKYEAEFQKFERDILRIAVAEIPDPKWCNMQIHMYRHNDNNALVTMTFDLLYYEIIITVRGRKGYVKMPLYREIGDELKLGKTYNMGRFLEGLRESNPQYYGLINKNINSLL